MSQYNRTSNAHTRADAALDKLIDGGINWSIKSIKRHRARVGRAFMYAFVAYCMLWLQSLFDFSYMGMSTVIFLLALGNKTRLIAEFALGLILLSIFIPPSVPPALL